MRLLYLILRPDTLWGRGILILLLLTVLFFLPAVVIHRHEVRRMIAQRKPIFIGLFVFLMMALFIQADFNLIKAHSFAKIWLGNP